MDIASTPTSDAALQTDSFWQRPGVVTALRSLYVVVGAVGAATALLFTGFMAGFSDCSGDAIAEIDRLEDVPARDKLYMVAGFIIDSYRHEPDLMKVIIVEVTRAANSFGRLHLEKIREAYAGIGGIVEAAREEGDLSENAEYHAAREEQGHLEARVRLLEELLASAEVIEAPAGDKAQVGSCVRFRDASSGDEKEITLKRLYREGDSVRLQPANTAMDPIFTRADNVDVQGRLVTVVRAIS